MSEPITDAQLAEWERLCWEATAGPWWVCGHPWGDGTSVHAGPSADPHRMTESICDFDLMSHQFERRYDGIDSDDIPGLVRPNMTFIAAARTAMPALLAEVRRLRTAISEHHAQKADDRCVEDDDRLYAAAGLPPCDRRVGSKEEMLANCARFIERRCEGGGWPSYRELEAEVLRLRAVADAAREVIRCELDSPAANAWQRATQSNWVVIQGVAAWRRGSDCGRRWRGWISDPDPRGTE